MVHYLQEVQGPKYVVGRDSAFIAATPEARRLFLSTAKYLLQQARTPRSIKSSVLVMITCTVSPSAQCMRLSCRQYPPEPALFTMGCYGKWCLITVLQTAHELLRHVRRADYLMYDILLCLSLIESRLVKKNCLFVEENGSEGS